MVMLKLIIILHAWLATNAFHVFTDYGAPCQKPISGFMRTVNGNCDRRAALQGIKLCEEGPDGRDQCISAAISSSGTLNNNLHDS